jgi:GTP cyclohydrolase II
VPARPNSALISPTHSVERAAGEFRRGIPVLIDSDRDITSLTVAAETVGDQTLQIIAATGLHGSLMITQDRAVTLKIPRYTDRVIAIALTSDVTAEHMRAIADPATDLDYPLKGPFQINRTPPDEAAVAAVRLAKLAGLLPAAAVYSVTPAERMRLISEGLTEVPALHIAQFPETTAESLRLIVRATVPLSDSEHAELAVFRPADGGPEHYAVLIGDKTGTALVPPGPVLTRLHSECFTGDLLASLKCDCGDQLRGAVKAIADAGGGILLYLAQEGRGIGLMNKLRAYRLQDEGYDTLEANRRLGFAEDERLYDVAARMLQILGFSEVRLLTNNPQKMRALQQAGIEVVARVPHSFPDNLHNREYLRTMHHRHQFVRPAESCAVCPAGRPDT